MSRIVTHLIFLFLVAMTQPLAAHYGAQYEPPDGKTYHGVGWHTPSQNDYTEMFPDSLQPLLFQSMMPLPGDVRRRGGMTVERLLATLRADQIDQETQYSEISVHFTDNSTMFDSIFAHTDSLDGFIDTMAIAFAEYGRPIFLRIGLEMNGAWNDYTPWTFPDAFRKLVEGLRDLDVDNFASVWCYEPDAPDDFADSTRNGWKWYPGDDVVDWFGLDLFDLNHFDPDAPDSTEQRGRWVISKKGKSEKFLRFAHARRKPVYLNELTAQHVWITPHDEEVDSTHGEVDWNAWFVPFFEFMEDHPNVKAFNYINLNWTNYEHWEHWGDARLQINEYIRDHWVEALSDERYLHAGYDISRNVSVSNEESNMPDEFEMAVYPNPFNSSFMLNYHLTETSNITLKLYSLTGALIWSAPETRQDAGIYQAFVDGRGLASGVYLLRLETANASAMRKVVLIR